MSTARRHHYLPQFYLDGFASHRNLWLFDRERNEFRRQTPVNTAVERDYYAFLTEDQQTRNDIEDLFSRIEGETRPIIDKLVEKSWITSDDRVMLSFFVGFLKLRTPVFEKTFNEISEEMIKFTVQRIVTSPERAQAILDEQGAGKESRVTADEFYEFVQKDQFGINFHRNDSLRAILDVGLQVGVALSRLDWVVGHCSSDTSFVTSDNPVILVESSRSPRELGIGILTPGVGKAVPLNQSTCLMMFDQGEQLKHIELSRKQVRDLNLAVTKRCERFVIGRDEQLIRKLVRTTGVDRTDSPKRFTIT